MTPAARDHEEIFSVIRCMCAVPMLPVALMWAGVLEIWNEVPMQWRGQMLPLFAYFESEWLPRKEELCVFKLASRTNNCSESDNRALASVIPENKPNIYHLIGETITLKNLLRNFLIEY